MLLSIALAPSVSANVRDRGRELFSSGAVTLESVDPIEVFANVRDSRKYDVDLYSEERKVHASCTCPFIDEFGAPCKHIWATVLAADPRGFAADAIRKGPLRLTVVDDYDDYEDPERYRELPRARPSLSNKPPVRKTWIDQLAALRTEIETVNAFERQRPVTFQRQLLFVIDVPASWQAKKLVLELQFQELKKNGEWGKPKAQQLPTYQLDSFAEPLDRQLLALLGGAERGDSYGYAYGSPYSSYGVSRYRLAGPVLETVLPMLARTGRVVQRLIGTVPATLENLVPDLDPPWVLRVQVSADESGKQVVLAGQLHRGEETLSLEEPTLIVPGLIVWNGRYCRFDDAGAFAWVPPLRKAGTIAVPAAKGEQLLEELLRMPQLPGLVLPEELRYTEDAVPPRPKATVKPAKRSYGQPLLEVELAFEYDGIAVPARPATRGFFQRDRKRFVVRDIAAEDAAARELNRLGARPRWAGEESLELAPANLPKLVRELVAAGWKIEADGKLYRQAGKFDLAVESDRDWFDLNGTADFDGLSVPFPRLLDALRRGESSVVLGDGSLGMLPEDWLKKYALFAQMGTVEGDSVRFSRAQVGVLDALLASRPEVTFDEQFGRARAALQKFTGVAAADPPKVFKGELREYQREGLGWLRFIRKFGFGGCLADDMGLGKTVQVLALLAGKRDGPALVVVPKSLIFNWKQETAKFAPKLKLLDHTGTARDRTGANFQDFDVILTTYGTLRNDADTFAAVQFDTCILDESQAAKNAQTETAKAVRVVRADHRLALSGTPVENHLGELWTLFDFLNPGMLGRAMLLAGGGGSIRNPDAETREILAKALKPFILRRTKNQVAKDLPAKTEQTVYCDLEPAQRQLYDELRAHYRMSLLSRVDSLGLKRSKIHVLEALLRLRQAACHPGLIDKKRKAEPSAKLDVLLPQLQELSEGGSKVLVFSQFTSFLDIVRSRLTADGVAFEYLDGRTRDRAERVERFQTDPDCRLFLVSLKAGGVGLNLTAAEYVFLLDPWWNPAVEAQAIDRTHRIGQTKPVFAYRLIARGTVEEKVLELQRGKRELADAILGGDGSLITDLKREDLELLLS